MATSGIDNELTRADFEGLPSRLLWRGSRHSPDVLLYEVNGELVALKDFRGKPWVWRILIGLFLISREAGALRALAGMSGIPQFRGMPDRYSLAMTYIACEPVSKWKLRRGGDERLAAELEGLVAEMHRRGVVHLDLKHRTNVAATPDGHAVLLDFASALRFNPGWFGGRLMVKLLGAPDRLAVAKWKSKLGPRRQSRVQKRRVEFLRLLGLALRPLKLLKKIRRGLRRRGRQ
ncbi:MAG: hypothetical protein QGH74_08980 [Candidatus Brocadiia bacterium]|jgi:hypothetical protein|nr:hypothetical protein [Candidatus Brocadiia bacterium]